MAYLRKRSIFEQLAEQRHSLIQQFAQGDLTKREFIIANYKYLESLQMKPFKKIDSFEKGFYNYQYYNTLAKYYRILADDAKKKSKHQEVYQEYINESNTCYYLKEQTISKILQFIEFKNIKAYHIKTKSNFLKGDLIEIVLEDYDNVILHSRSKRLLEILKREGVFTEEVKKSIIDPYVNQKY